MEAITVADVTHGHDHSRRYCVRLASGLARVALLSLLAIGLVGCSNAGSVSPTPNNSPTFRGTSEPLASNLVTLFQQTLDNGGIDYGGLSDQETTVIQRAINKGSISAKDYEATFVSYQTCMNQNGIDGISWKKGPDGVYVMQPWNYNKVSFSNAQLSDAQSSCRYTFDAVQFLFTTQQSNPDLYSDPREAAIACLQRHGFVDVSYTPAQLDHDFAGNGDVPYTFPFDPMDPVANACLSAAGYGIQSIDGI